MGGPSNIHNPGQILEGAGRNFASTQAIIMPIQKWVNRAGRNFDQLAVDKMSPYLRSGIVDEWVTVTSDAGVDKVQRVAADDINPVPTVHASDPYGKSHRLKWDDKLAYIVIVMGKNACRTGKVLVEYTQNCAGQSILREALNGYSTLFTAAMLKEDAEEVFTKHKFADLRFIKVEEAGFVRRPKDGDEQPQKPNPDMDAKRVRHSDGKLKQVAIWC